MRLRRPHAVALALLSGALIAALIAAPAAQAAQQGRIQGKVTDGKGTPLADVKIVITTPAITTFKLELKTDKDGKWGTILNDSTLRYHYHFEKEGYMAFDTDKKVPIGSTEILNAELLTQSQAVEKGVVKEVVDPFTKSYNEAVEKLQAGDEAGALASALEAAKAGPDKANGHDLVAKLAFKTKDWKLAASSGEKSLALDADNPQLYGLMLESYKQLGDKEKVKEYEVKFAKANPDNPDLVYNQAVELYNKSDAKGAEPLLVKVLEIKPDHAKAHYLLGMCYVNLNKIPEMKKHLNEYLKLEPKGSDAGTAKEMLDAFK